MGRKPPKRKRGDAERRAMFRRLNAGEQGRTKRALTLDREQTAKNVIDLEELPEWKRDYYARNPGKGHGMPTNIERSGGSANTVPTTAPRRILSDHEKTQIMDALMWSGCLVISTQVAISPHACPIIMGVIKACRNYKAEIGNQNDLNRNDFKELLKIASSGIGTKLSKKQIEDYSNIIVGVTDSNGLTSHISNETNVNESTIRAMMKGTASNLLENRINTTTNFAIGVLV